MCILYHDIWLAPPAASHSRAQDVLPALHALAAAQDEVSFNRLFPAADLINRLAAGTRSGLPAVRQALGRLLWHCNQVLMQQLAAWWVRGRGRGAGRLCVRA